MIESVDFRRGNAGDQHQISLARLWKRLEIREDQPLGGEHARLAGAKDQLVRAAELGRLVEYLDRTGHVLKVDVGEEEHQHSAGRAARLWR